MCYLVTKLPGNFPEIFLLLISNLISPWSENILCMTCIPLNILMLALWPRIWSVFVNVPCPLEPTVYLWSLAGVFCKCQSCHAGCLCSWSPLCTDVLPTDFLSINCSINYWEKGIEIANSHCRPGCLLLYKQLSAFISHILKKTFYLYLSLAVLDLCCCVGFFPSCSAQGPLSTCNGRASHWGAFSCCRAWVLGAHGLQQLWLPRSRAQAQELWCPGLFSLWHVGSSRIWDWTHISCLGRWILYHWANREAPVSCIFKLCYSKYKCLGWFCPLDPWLYDHYKMNIFF